MTTTIDPKSVVDIEEILKQETNIKNLLNIELPATDDNILLLKAICLMLYNSIKELERKVD